MAIDIKLPELGENIESGDVSTVLVSVGDTIAIDAPLVELETDKAVVEVPASSAGIITQVHVSAGDTIRVGESIVSIDPAATAAGPADTQPTAAAPNGAGSVTDATPAAAAPATAAPLPEQPLQAPQRPQPPEPPAVTRSDVPAGSVAATPTVRRVAREIGVDITTVVGSGRGGRVLAEDVKATAKRLLQAAAGNRADATGSATTTVQPPPLPDFATWGQIDVEPMNTVRRKTAQHLSSVWQTVPMVTQQDKADITELEQLRERYAPRAEQAGGKLTITAVLVKVVASALKVFPQFNSSVDLANANVIYKRYYHVGVAAATERGLLVPVIRDADRKNMMQIAVELGDLSRRARERKLTPDEIQGGTFSISNLGGLGGGFFTPLINAPEVAILGVSRSEQEAVFDPTLAGFVPRLRMPLSLTYDHRVIDGADAVRFLRWIVDTLEEPLLLSLEG